MKESNGLTVTQIKVSDLQAHPENYKEHPPEQVKKLRQSLRARGFLKPIVVHKERGLILAGHGIFAAAVAEGFKEVPVHLWSTTNEKADAYLVDDNELDRDSFYDTKKQAALLERLAKEAAEAAEAVGLYAYGEDELDTIIARAIAVADEAAIEAEGGEEGDDAGAPLRTARDVALKAEALVGAGYTPAAAEALASAGVSAKVYTEKVEAQKRIASAQPAPTAERPPLRIPLIVFAENVEQETIIRTAFKHETKVTELSTTLVLEAARHMLQKRSEGIVHIRKAEGSAEGSPGNE